MSVSSEALASLDTERPRSPATVVVYGQAFNCLQAITHSHLRQSSQIAHLQVVCLEQTSTHYLGYSTRKSNVHNHAVTVSLMCCHLGLGLPVAGRGSRWSVPQLTPVNGVVWPAGSVPLMRIHINAVQISRKNEFNIPTHNRIESSHIEIAILG